MRLNIFGRTPSRLALAGLAALATALPAAAADPPTSRQCFMMQDWNGWHAPDAKTLYIRVGVSQIWRIDLNSECGALRDPTAHLVTKVHGSSSICSAIDLDLSVQDTGGFSEPCFVKSIRRLTPAEAAALDRKDRP